MKKNWNKKAAALLSIIIAGIIIFAFNTGSKGSSLNEDKLIKYLSNNSSEIDKDNFNESNFKLLNSDLNKNIVFFSGHEYGFGSEENAELDFQLLKYFNKRAGVKFYLSDIQFSASEIINRYLNTGDEFLIKKLYSHMNNTDSYDLGPYDKWTSLYKYNKTLDKDNEIRVCGIGVEGNIEHTFIYLNMLIDEGEKPSKAIEGIIIDIKNYKNVITDGNSYCKFLRRINDDILVNTDEYKKCFGKNYDNFKYVIDEEMEILKGSVGTMNNEDFNKIYQNALFKNFKKVYTKQGGKYYGNFNILTISRKHISTGLNDYKYFGEMLESEDSPVNNKILSIEFLYKNCKLLNKYEPNASCSDIITVDSKVNNIDLIDKASKSDITLFKLNGLILH